MKNKSNYPQWLVDTTTTWFYSLPILDKIRIAEEYTDITGDNTDISKGLNTESETWLLCNYEESIIDFTK